MPLRATIDSIDDIDESLRPHYQQDNDGAYVLDVDGFEGHPAARALKNALDAERSSRKRAVRKVAELSGKLDEANTVESEALPEYALGAKADDAGADEPIRMAEQDAAVEALIRQEVDRKRQTHVAELDRMSVALKSAEADALAARNDLATAELRNRILTAATELGVRRTAINDVFARARETWQLDGTGTPVPKRGGEVIVGPDGSAPLTLNEWLASLAIEASHLFEGSLGGTATGSIVGGLHGMAPSLGGRNAIGNNLEAVARGEMRLVDSRGV